jgi:hypothetical protein
MIKNDWRPPSVESKRGHLVRALHFVSVLVAGRICPESNRSTVPSVAVRDRSCPEMTIIDLGERHPKSTSWLATECSVALQRVDRIEVGSPGRTRTCSLSVNSRTALHIGRSLLGFPWTLCRRPCGRGYSPYRAKARSTRTRSKLWVRRISR